MSEFAVFHHKNFAEVAHSRQSHSR